MTTTTHADQAARWIAARDRALAEHVTIHQVESTGQWVATSGTKPGIAYELDVIGNVVAKCHCRAGEHDQICKHAALFYHLIGAIPCTVDALEAEDVARDAAAMLATRPCFACSGRGEAFNEYYLDVRPCYRCGGTGSGLRVVA